MVVVYFIHDAQKYHVITDVKDGFIQSLKAIYEYFEDTTTPGAIFTIGSKSMTDEDFANLLRTNRNIEESIDNNISQEDHDVTNSSNVLKMSDYRNKE